MRIINFIIMEMAPTIYIRAYLLYYAYAGYMHMVMLRDAVVRVYLLYYYSYINYY